jgi:hypothetical protein
MQCNGNRNLIKAWWRLPQRFHDASTNVPPDTAGYDTTWYFFPPSNKKGANSLENKAGRRRTKDRRHPQNEVTQTNEQQTHTQKYSLLLVTSNTFVHSLRHSTYRQFDLVGDSAFHRSKASIHRYFDLSRWYVLCGERRSNQLPATRDTTLRK